MSSDRQQVQAQSSTKVIGKVFGEMVACSRATKNGRPALSGLTVMTNDRVRTDEDGVALISLGRRGRIEVGGETDVAIKFSETTLDLELHNGRLIVSAPKGVSVAVATDKGMIRASGNLPSVFSVNLSAGTSFLVVHQGEARVASQNGSELKSVSASSTKDQKNGFTPFSLFSAGVKVSAKSINQSPRRQSPNYETSVTCRENETMACRKWGAVAP